MPGRAGTTSARLFASVLLAGLAHTAAEHCAPDETWREETLSYDLSGCSIFNATSVPVNMSALVLALDTTEDLTTLRLVNNRLGPDEFGVLAGALADHVSLTHLQINQNIVAENGAAALAAALSDNTVLTHLKLIQCDLRNEGAIAIGELLRNNSALVDVNIEFNDIATAGMTAIGGALQENNVLRSLNLGVNPIFPAGAVKLANGLRRNTALEVLNVRYCGIQDNGMVAIANALGENRVLRDLDVWYNAIGDTGVAAMGHTLKENAVLKRLNFWHNNITDLGVAELATGLGMGNARLESLHLGRNGQIGDASAVSLQRVMYSDESLKFIDFGQGGTGVGETFEKPLMQACKCNERLQVELKETPTGGFADESRSWAADCRSKALAQVPMRVSIKEMMKAQGFDRDKFRKEQQDTLDNVKRLRAEIDKLPAEQRDLVLKKINEAREKQKKEQGLGGAEKQDREVKLPVNSPHAEHLEKKKKKEKEMEKEDVGPLEDGTSEPKGKTGKESLEPKKHRATREQQEARRRKREQVNAKEEL